jgi:DNA topoisomerase I
LKLVVVESPAKAKTIEKYLGPGHRVLASYGHVRDLPPKDGSVDPDDGFAMLWETYPDKARQLKAISDEAKKADTLILATDPDREGEAISWHVQEVLRKKKLLPAKVERVTFNAITEATVTEAMKHPRELDEDLIDAYRARRALDYLVGFTLSPILWRKLPGAKSAGRVQSVALRLIVDREREIELFRPQEYWSISAQFESDGQSFTARLVGLDGKKIERLHRCVDRNQAVHPQPAAAVHHLDLAAGSFAQAWLFGQPHDATRPVALRGRADHLHADRRGGYDARSGQRRPPGDRRPL